MDKDLGKEILLEGNILGKRKISINKSKVTDVYSYTHITEKDEEEFVRDNVIRRIILYHKSQIKLS